MSKDACKPAEGAEINTWHWLAKKSYPPSVWFWRGWCWELSGSEDEFLPENIAKHGWNYLYPASPDDAADLAEARADFGHWRNDYTELQGVNADLRSHVAALTAKNAALRAALGACVASLERADTTEGYCCCGDTIESHGFGPGHAPVDIGSHYANLALEAARAALAQPTSTEDAT